MHSSQSNHAPIRRALISVSDKSGLAVLAAALRDAGCGLLSTGGSAQFLREQGFAITEVGDYTGFPEMMDGRVKTLHPKIHGGILQQRHNPAHQAAAAGHGIGAIDLVVVNLYPFAQTVAKGGDYETCIENIDIGGPSMVRAAAKNHADVAVLTSPQQYESFLAEFAAQKGGTRFAFRQQLAAQAFAHMAAYDSAVASWFAQTLGEAYPPTFTPTFTRKQTLRYGENPHQAAALYLEPMPVKGAATALQVQGKELSYNNYNDADAAFELASEFSRPTVAIIKHANPCGVASGDNLLAAYQHALACDPVSAFGGVIALNGRLDAATAEAIATIFTEVIIAPEADEAAKQLLAAKKNLRLLLTGGMAEPGRGGGVVLRSIAGGLLVQQRDHGCIGVADLKQVTQRAPSPAEQRDLLFAFRVAKHVKSNAIVYAHNESTVGIGAGQMSRVDSARIAAWKGEEAAKKSGIALQGCVVASDAFFPFADGLMEAVRAGATAVIQPGGSLRDAEVIAAADAAGLAMVFTGMRHFRH